MTARRTRSAAPRTRRSSTGSSAACSTTSSGRSPASTSGSGASLQAMIALLGQPDSPVVGRRPDDGPDGDARRRSSRRALDEAGAELRAAYGDPAGLDVGQAPPGDLRARRRSGRPGSGRSSGTSTRARSRRPVPPAPSTTFLLPAASGLPGPGRPVVSARSGSVASSRSRTCRRTGYRSTWPTSTGRRSSRRPARAATRSTATTAT